MLLRTVVDVDGTPHLVGCEAGILRWELDGCPAEDTSWLLDRQQMKAGIRALVICINPCGFKMRQLILFEGGELSKLERDASQCVEAGLSV